MKTLSIVLATVLTSSLAGAAHATTPADGIRRQEVRFADLDLSREAGAETLYQRIRAAARDVCWTPGVLGLLMVTETRHCIEQATARAIADVNAPSLTRYHAARDGAAYDAG